MIDFPYTVGYGMTECGPIICYEDWTRFKPGSCGKAAPRMDVRVLSSDPENIVGEIVCKGPNVMLGYYKNSEATEAVIDKDGWLHTATSLDGRRRQYHHQGTQQEYVAQRQRTEHLP